MLARVLTVCIGNICRSPMAEGLFRSRLGTAVHVSSAGLSALEGRPAHPIAVELLAERGVDISAHRARRLTAAMVADADLVLVMDDEQRRGVEALMPGARGRVYRLGRFGGFDVPDPYGEEREAFERVLALVERGVRDFERKVLGGGGKGR